ncbi:MAG: hypothetical protein JWQ08_2345 [Deinococcus sp.]|nr:hypothetical protein [Deinococcus sp.]
MKNLKLPALTATLLLTATFTGAQAQTGQQVLNPDNANVYFLVDTGRAGAVDLFVDGQKVVAHALATDTPTLLTLTPGNHDILVKTSYDGVTIAQNTVDVATNENYALAFGNDDSAVDYDLTFMSGSHTIQQYLNGE